MTYIERSVLRVRDAMIRHYRAEWINGRMSRQAYRQIITPILSDPKTAPERSPRAQERKSA